MEFGLFIINSFIKLNSAHDGKDKMNFKLQVLKVCLEMKKIFKCFIYFRCLLQRFHLFIICELSHILLKHNEVISCCLLHGFLFFIIHELPCILGNDNEVVSHCLFYRCLFFIIFKLPCILRKDNEVVLCCLFHGFHFFISLLSVNYHVSLGKIMRLFSHCLLYGFLFFII